MISRTSFALLLALACPSIGLADELEIDAALGDLPVAYVDRPLNLPAKYIRLDGRMDAYRVLGQTHVDMNVGFALGLTSSIEFGVSSHRLGAIGDGIGNPGPVRFFGQGGAVPLSLRPGADDPRFESVQLYGRIAAVQAAEFNLSIDVGAMIPTQSDLPWVMFVGVPIRARLSERFSLDAAAEFSVAFFDDATDGTDPYISMHIPIAGVLNIVPQLYIAGRSGIYLPNMDFNEFTIPMTLELGVTVAGERPWFDLVGSFGFPRLLVPGAEDPVDANYWVASFGINGFIGL